MKAEGTVNIFKRSIHTRGLRYVNFYGDDDSKSFSRIKNIYRCRKVRKYECVGHVQKRMGTRLRKLRKSVKGLGGNGKVTERMIDRLQNYYGISIRRNAGQTVQEMKKTIWGGFFHVCSSRAKPYHTHCDPSWCK